MQKKSFCRSLLILGCFLGMKSANASLFFNLKNGILTKKQDQSAQESKQKNFPYHYIAISIAQESKKSINKTELLEPNDFGFGKATRKAFIIP